ncbi:MAG: ArsR family transcriptional regulator [Candidatus Heimdallarchaeota archaeon]|nr:ArsR family transcriptional regulator [Candidatus Heimdallarchaeota archaeon]
MTDLKISNALKILGNEYRREILRLLTIEDRYAFELSKLLNISQRAVKKHLDFLKEMGIVKSEKRKSTEGPEREYFELDRAVIISFTMAKNLFRASVRALDEDRTKLPPISPSLQLDVPKKGSLDDMLVEGLNLLPQIQEGLDLLQIQQNRLLRAYQGLQSHIIEHLEEENFSRDEIRVVLSLIENEGQTDTNELEIAIGKIGDLDSTLQSLEKKGMISVKYDQTDDGVVATIDLKEL